jgi:hypothetical protein
MLNHMTHASEEHTLSGVYSAAITPINFDLTPDLAGIPVLMTFLAD